MMGSVSGPIWVVDYDVPVKPAARRMAFYRALWKLLKLHGLERSGRSTQSVWIIDDEEIARDIHNLARSYGKSHLYNATPAD
jgi:hypothetical protein